MGSACTCVQDTEKGDNLNLNPEKMKELSKTINP